MALIVIVMGVTGSGKTTIGQLLASRTHVQFADGDDFHPAANKAKLAAGTPLTDADRQPWLERLDALLLDWHRSGEGGVLACSALKATYRETLLKGLPAGAAVFVLLEGSRALIAARLTQRHEHFMNPALLDSQLATLEEPGEGVLHVCNDGTPDGAVDKIVAHFGSLRAEAPDAGDRVSG